MLCARRSAVVWMFISLGGCTLRPTTDVAVAAPRAPMSTAKAEAIGEAPPPVARPAETPEAVLIPTTAETPLVGRRWVYDATLTDGATGQRSTHRVELVELSRAERADVTITTMVALLDAQRITATTLDAFGTAPFLVFGVRLVLLSGKHDGQAGVWMLFGDDQDIDDAAISRALATPPTWPLAVRKTSRPSAADHPDEAVYYRRKVSRWDSVCVAMDHPSPDSGDFFSFERCFAAAAGVTRLEFSSAWGGYALDLVTPPSDASPR